MTKLFFTAVMITGFGLILTNSLELCDKEYTGNAGYVVETSTITCWHGSLSITGAEGNYMEDPNSEELMFAFLTHENKKTVKISLDKLDLFSDYATLQIYSCGDFTTESCTYKREYSRANIPTLPSIVFSEYAPIVGIRWYNFQYTNNGWKITWTFSNDCQFCSKGKYKSVDVINKCIGGQYDSTISTDTFCDLCPKGKYGDKLGSTTSSDCIGCQAGLFNAELGKSSCNFCSAGTYNQNSGLSNCLLCDIGKYSLGDGVTACISCLVGSYML
jgi:hypothetical protein